MISILPLELLSLIKTVLLIKVSLKRLKDFKIIFIGSLWITNNKEFRRTKLNYSNFSFLEPTGDVLSMSLMTQHNHNKILLQRKRMDFISSNLNVLIAAVSLGGDIEYQNNSFH